IHSEFIYRRNRQMEKQQPGFIQRQNRRRVKRGQALLSIETCKFKSGKQSNYHHIQLKSSHNQQQFSLFIERQKADEKRLGYFNHYGLATTGNKEDGTTSPTIPHCIKTLWQPTSDRKSTRLNSSHVSISYAD